MFIKRVILDGFKSYANRTVVDKFDEEFNAITGLNGSGKSNILDSICFVLGITNLTQVRAKSLQELVYKNGQAGVTKASVSIVFDNTDKEQSPVGYSDQDEITVTRQVVIGGKNKYLINGHNAQKGRVENFFHSVQLNVNNPHFLIMQGRITKVLNMKPREILSMIEEAAGTRMYETKKAVSLQTMEKKEQKMNEIERMLSEEIQPTLDKLRKERSAFLEWQKNKMELDHLNRLLVAHMYMQAEDLLKRSKEEMQNMEQEVENLEADVVACAKEADDCNAMVGKVEAERDQVLAGDLQTMEAEADSLSKTLVKATEKWKSKRADVAAEIESRDAAVAALDGAKGAIPQKEAEIVAAEKAYTTAVETLNGCVTAQEKEEARYNAVSLGMATDEDGGTKTFADQLKDANNALSSLSTEVEQARMRVDHLKPTLKDKKAAVKGSEKEHAKMCAKLEVTEKVLKDIEVHMSKCGFSEEREGELQHRQRDLTKEAGLVRDRCDKLNAKLANFDFNYSNPEPGFDRSKVSGMVAKLITVKDPKAMTALEVSAGGKLYNVVVDTEETGKKLLSKGKLQRRVTIIPLNKIAPRNVSPKVVAEAKKIVGNDNAHVALSFVGYEDKLDNAMKYVFGGNFICPDMNAAKQVTFNDNIRTKSVTLEGDVMDPSGTLSGGARPQTAPVLAQLHELRKATDRLAEIEAELKVVAAELSTIQKSAAKYNDLKSDFDIKTHELELTKKRIEQSSCGQAVQEVKDLETNLAESEGILANAKSREKELQAKIASIQKEMKEADSVKKHKLKEVEKAIAAAKKTVQKAKDAMHAAKQLVEEKKLELDALNAETETSQEQLGTFDKAIRELEEQEEALANKLAEIRQLYEEKDSMAKEHRKQVAHLESEIKTLKQKASDANKRSNTAKLELKKLTNKIATFDKKKKDAASSVDSLMKQNPWIAKEKHYFGQEGTSFEFKEGDASQDPKHFRSRIDTIVASQDKLSKSVNMKVMSMFDQTEKSAADLLKKKKIVEADRAKIAQAIEELDEKKNATLKKAYGQVNKDFGSIFSSLLPGTQAQLALTDTGLLLDGLQVRVAFGDVWKESLTELSGGQRSLVALSLILSLLLFKPAPIYILDEIDAALDLSHTQNIGQMLKAHFKQSQFIVVSLKEGMFNNANVLFKTAFVDGVSTVKRYAQSRKAIDSDGGSSAGSKENAEPGKGRARGGRSGRAMTQRN